jgi:hypothetical protein
LTKKALYFLQALLFGLVTVNLGSQIFGIRPIQDDYFILGAISSGSISELLSSTWKMQGGNLIPYAFSAWAAKYTAISLSYWLQAGFLLTTVILVIFLGLQFLRWLGVTDRNSRILLPLLLILCFEGVFTPLQIAAYSWAQTSLAHLWPILLTLIILFSVEKSKNIAPIYLLAGIVVGNSNSAEALWAIFSVILFVVFFIRDFSPLTQRSTIINLTNFLVGSISGLIFMLVAPGFWNRANNSVGFPASVEELIARFLKSLSAFGFDLLTHPFLFLTFFASAYLLGASSINLINLDKKIIFLLLSSLVLFALLVLGTTAGYPAWHQSLGLFPVFSLSAFILGIKYHQRIWRFKSKLAPLLFIIVLILSSLMSLRTSSAIAQRAKSWDIDFQRNYCLLIDSEITDIDQLPLSGPEIIYPFFNKGIEDIQTWEWMKIGYVKWIKSGKIQNPPDCEKF